LHLKQIAVFTRHMLKLD